MVLKENLDTIQKEAEFEQDFLDCFIYHSTYQPILKVLLTNKCQKNCAYSSIIAKPIILDINLILQF